MYTCTLLVPHYNSYCFQVYTPIRIGQSAMVFEKQVVDFMKDVISTGMLTHTHTHTHTHSCMASCSYCVCTIIIHGLSKFVRTSGTMVALQFQMLSELL